MNTSIVLASRNQKKAKEMRALLEPLGIELLTAADLNTPEVDETGESFAENAKLKASQVAVASGHWAVGDDSGLTVDALDGAPGVYSARYSGEGATDASNNAKLLKELAGVPTEKRGAAFVCHLAVADPNGEIRAEVSGVCRGRIIEDERGGEGFGYDPMFLVPEYHRTFGQLSQTAKGVISHRARAFRLLIPQLVKLLA